MPAVNLYGSQVVELYAFATAMNYRNLSGLKYCQLQSSQLLELVSINSHLRSRRVQSRATRNVSDAWSFRKQYSGGMAIADLQEVWCRDQRERSAVQFWVSSASCRHHYQGGDRSEAEIRLRLESGHSVELDGVGLRRD
jgi:hypothetical protein